jgi:hypothetical protein
MNKCSRCNDTGYIVSVGIFEWKIRDYCVCPTGETLRNLHEGQIEGDMQKATEKVAKCKREKT